MSLPGIGNDDFFDVIKRRVESNPKKLPTNPDKDNDFLDVIKRRAEQSPIDKVLASLKSNESTEGLLGRAARFILPIIQHSQLDQDFKETKRRESVNEDLLVFNNMVSAMSRQERDKLHKKIDEYGFEDEGIKNQLLSIIESVPDVSRETFEKAKKLSEHGGRLETNPIGRFTEKMAQAFSHGIFGVAQYVGAVPAVTVKSIDLDRAAREAYNSFISPYEQPSEDAIDIIKTTYGLEENFASNVAGMAGQMIPSMITTAVITYLTGGAGLANVGRLANLSRVARGSQVATRVLRGVEAIAGQAFEGSVVYGLGDYLATGGKDEGFLTGGIEGGLGAGIGKAASGLFFKKWFTKALSKRGMAAATARKTVDYLAITAGETATEFGSDWIKGDVSLYDLTDETGLEYLALSAFMALPFAAARSRRGFVHDTFTKMADDNIISRESVNEYTDHFLSQVGGTTINEFVEYVQNESKTIGEAARTARESGNVDLAQEFEDFKERPTPARLDRLRALATEVQGEPYVEGKQRREGSAILTKDSKEKLAEISEQVEQDETIRPHQRRLEIFNRFIRETGESPTGNIAEDFSSGVQQFIDEFKPGGNITEFFYEAGRSIGKTENFRNVAVLVDLADAIVEYERIGGTKLIGFQQLPLEAAEAFLGIEKIKGSKAVSEQDKQIEAIMLEASTPRERFGKIIKILHGEEAFNQYNKYFEEKPDDQKNEGREVPSRVEVRPKPGDVPIKEAVREASETSRILQESESQEGVAESTEIPDIESEPEEKREHETSLRIRQSADVKPDVRKKFLKSDKRFYTPIPVLQQQATAQAIIKQYGQDEIEKIVSNPPSDINPAVSIALGIELYRQYQADGKHEKAADMAVSLMLESSDYGRALGMMRTLLMDTGPITFGAIYERSLAEVEKHIIEKVEKTRSEIESLKAKIVEQVLADPKFTQQVEKATGIKRATRIEQIKSERARILTEMTESFGRLNASFVPGGEQLILAIRLAKTYIEEGVVRLSEFTSRFISDMRSAGMDVTQEAAESVWNNRDVQNYLNILRSPNLESLKKRAIGFLKAQAENKLLDRWIEKNDPIKKAFQAIQSSLGTEISLAGKERGLTKKRPRTYEDVVNRLALLAENKQALEEIWSKVKIELEKTELNEDEQSLIDEVFSPIFNQAFRTQSKKAIQLDMRQRGLKIREIVTASLESQTDLALTISNRLTEDSGLTGDEAVQIALAVADIFDSKKEKLRSQFTKIAKKLIPRKKTTIVDRIFQGYNIGIFDDQELTELYRDKYGLPKFDQGLLDKIIKDATEIEKINSPHFRQIKSVELLSFIQRQSGIAFLDVLKGIWYNGILAHPITFARNLTWILANLALEIGPIQTSSVLANNKEKFTTIVYMNKALLRGLRKGKTRSAEILRRGGHVSTHKLETEVDALDELKAKIDESDFPKLVKTLLNAYPSILKYGGSRALVATDALFYAGFKEFRYLQLGSAKLASQGLRGKELRQAIGELYAGTLSFESALLQAHNEGYVGGDLKIRAYELIDASRDSILTDAAHNYSLQATLNNKPRGWPGVIADALNSVFSGLQKRGKVGKAIEFIARTVFIPFVNIPANLIYNSWLYTPRIPIFEKKYAKDLDLARGNWSHEESEVWIRMVTGTALMALLLVDTFSDDDDKFFDVTGSGQLDINAFRIREAAGKWKPRQVRIGDVELDYSNLPGSHLFALLGELRDAKKYKLLEFNSIGRVLAFLMKGFFVTYFDNAMLRDTNLMMEKMGRLEDADPEADFSKYATRYLTSYIPRFGQFIDRVIDAEKKDPKLLDAAFLSEIPFARHTEKPALNILGEPIFYRSEEMWQRIKDGVVSDVLIDQFIKGSMDRDNPAMMELAKTDYYPILLPEHMEIEYDSESEFGDVIKNTYQPTQDERYQINKNAGTAFKSKILELQSNPDYQELSKSSKKDMLENILSRLRFNEKQRILEKAGLIDEAETLDVDDFGP